MTRKDQLKSSKQHLFVALLEMFPCQVTLYQQQELQENMIKIYLTRFKVDVYKFSFFPNSISLSTL